ncbi:MAG: 3-methyladenine DNA glycosylase 2 [Pseudomonadota bacterium]
MNNCTPISTLFSFNSELPANFQKNNFLDFHKRDSLMIAERIHENTLEKGFIWKNHPVCLTLTFHPQHINATVAIDGYHQEAADLEIFKGLVHRMLGLHQPIETFELLYSNHPLLGPLIANNAGLRVPLTATPFEALTWAITGQQISVHAAVSIRRKLIQRTGLQHANGLWCYPSAHQLISFSEDEFRQLGYSLTKARTLLALSHSIEHKHLKLEEEINDQSVEKIRAQLLTIKGIGPWTINYALLRGFGWLDGSLHGDAAIRRHLQTLLGSDEKISEEQAKQWLAEFSPWRALVAAHVWAMPK